MKGFLKWGFGVILGVCAKIFGGKVHPSSEMRVSDICGPDLTPRVVAFLPIKTTTTMGIAICHRRKFGQVWGPHSPAPLPEVVGNLRSRKLPFGFMTTTWKSRNHSGLQAGHKKVRFGGFV